MGYEKFREDTFEFFKYKSGTVRKCMCGQNDPAMMFTIGEMRIAKCKCGMIYNVTPPAPESLEEFYNSKAMDSWAEIKNSAHEKKRQESKFTDAARMICGSTTKKVLDLGCGSGKFLELVKKTKPSVECTGVDLNHFALQCVPSSIKTVKSDIMKYLSVNKEKFDVISMWGILEHSWDPSALLKAVSSKLTPGGTCLICVPNADSNAVFLLRESCYTFCPQHLWYFTSTTLQGLLSRQSFKTEHYWTVEAEGRPCLRRIALLDPYKQEPSWAEITDSTVESYEKGILENNTGYKIIALGKKTTPIQARQIKGGGESRPDYDFDQSEISAEIEAHKEYKRVA